MTRAAFALVAVACACGRSPSPSKAPPPDQGAPVPVPVTATPDATSDELPNARVRLRLHSRGPAVGEHTIEQTIWLRGSRFRVRLGDAPRTMEEIMDRKSAALRPPPGPTDIYGDLAGDTAWIYTHFYVREVIALDLDVVTDADVTRP
jgi:hypothetical protein